MFDRFSSADYSVGDPIFFQVSDGWKTYTARRYSVTNKTPTGQIVAELDGLRVRVNLRGEVVGETLRGARVCSSTKAAELLAAKRVRVAWHKIYSAGEALTKAARKQDGDALSLAMSDLASAIEARRAATLGAVHESAVGTAETPDPKSIPDLDSKEVGR